MRFVLVLAGALAIGYGAVLGLGLVLDGSTPLVGLGAWWLAGPLLVDLVAVPVVVVAGVGVRRVVPVGWRRFLATGLGLSLLVTIVAVPFVSGAGRRPDNPSLLDRDYVAGYLALLAVVWAASALTGYRDRVSEPAGPAHVEEQPGSGDSALTVAIAFGANLLIAIAKTVAAVLTGAASMVAEASHSWADTGNEVFLLIAQRRAARPPDKAHPLGYGREIYVWSLFAAIGLFAVGAGVSITHGIQELLTPEPAQDFVVAYVVLGISALLEGISFVQASRQAKAAAGRRDRDLWTHVLSTSDPTVRAVFFEDAAALVGIAIAAVGIGLHQATGSVVPDAVGSILVGVLLGVVAVVLIDRNRRFLVGEVVDSRVWNAALAALLAQPEVERVTELRLSLVGAGQAFLSGAVDLVGNPDERTAATQLADLERRVARSNGIVLALISLSAPDDPSLVPRGRRDPSES